MSGRRMIHGDIAEDKKINSVSEGAETMFFRLLAKTDDFGRYFGDPALLKGKIYPRRDELTVQDIEARLAELVDAKLLIFYEADDDLFIQFRGFEKRQSFRKDVKRKSRFPEPPSRWGIDASVKLVTDTFGLVTGRDEREQARPDSSPSRIRSDTFREGKEREGKERKENSIQGGGGGGVGSTYVRENDAPPPPPSEGDFSSSPCHSIPEEFRVPGGTGEVAFIVQIYLSRFPNSEIPERSVRKQVDRALSCKVTTQELYEEIERTAAASATKAEKIWTLVDALIERKSVTGSTGAGTESTGAGTRRGGAGGGLSLDELKNISVSATEGKGGKE